MARLIHWSTSSTAAGLTVNGGGVNLYQTGGTSPFALAGTYELMEYTGTLGGSPANLSILDPQAGFSYNFGTNTVGGNTYVDVTLSVPEPSTAALFILGGVGGLLRRRRRKA